MKRTTFVAAVVCLLGTGLSCTHDEPNNSGTGTSQRVEEWQDSTLSGDAVIGFSVGSVMSVERQGSTRSTAAYNGTCAFSEGDRIAIRVSRNSVVEDVKLYEVQSDGSLECLDTYPFTWRSLSDAVDIQAWSYGDASTTKAAPEDSDYSLETNQQTNGYKELLYCNAPGTGYSANSITLNFYHQLARVVFNVNHEATGTLSISSQTVGNTTSFPKTAVFSVPTGNNTVGTWDFTASTYGTIIPKTESTQTGYQATYSAVIFPKTYAKSTQFFTVNNSDGDYVYNISENAGFTPTAGNQYNYTVTVKDDSGIPATTDDIGKIICTKGHIHNTVSAVTCGGTAAAMIVYVGTPGTADSGSSTYKGLAIALTDADVAAGTTNPQWFTSQSGTCVSQNSTFSAHYGYTYMDGIVSTERLTGKKVGRTSESTTKCNAGHTHAAADIAIAYGVTVPPGTSGWFLPSSGQWIRFFRNTTLNLSWSDWGYSNDGASGFSKINKMFTDAGASGAVFAHRRHLWSSTEISTSVAMAVAFDSGLGVYLHSFSYKDHDVLGVRCFLAF